MHFQGHLVDQISPQSQVCSSGNGAHFGSKHP